MRNENKNSERARYSEHKRRAKRRKIPFLFTYEEWCVVWMESGKWEQRGHCRGDYCMARIGDQGAYEPGNVRICLVEENAAERNRNFPTKSERSRFYGQNMWLTFSEESKQKHRQAGVARYARLSAAEKAALAHRSSLVVKGMKRDARGWLMKGDGG